MSSYKNLAGQRFGRLVVIEDAGRHRSPSGQIKVLWRCRCDCGNEVVVASGHLVRGMTSSCGCYKREQTQKSNSTHHQSKTRLYRIWQSMKRRCLSENNPAYPRYGQRGIKICDEWKDSFETFAEWAQANGYQEDLSIDRIDNNGNYEPSNCRWTDAKTQANNTRRNLKFKYNGRGVTIRDLSDISGVPYETIKRRIVDLGWSVEDAVNTPVREMHKRS